MSAMNTAISGAWSGLPYAMTAAGGVGGFGLIGLAIAAVVAGIRKSKKSILKEESLKMFDFGEGCTQYQYPEPRNDAQDCSFIAAYSILYIRDHISQFVHAIKTNDVQIIKQLHLNILEKGYEISHPENKTYCASGAVNPHEFKKYTNKFAELNIPEKQEEILGYIVNNNLSFGFFSLGFRGRQPKTQVNNDVKTKPDNKLKEETYNYLKDFFVSENRSNSLSYLLTVVDGQTFSLVRHDQYVFLFDSHRSCFRVVDLNTTHKYILRRI
ncbi:MAG: hypothetical protein KDK55_06955 [Chlamydiia bacterium]|nr:hypothetical protein [Chlamydiia bacterium]